MKKRRFIIIFIAVLLALSVVGGVLAKYASGHSTGNNTEAKDFVFTSDYLTEDGKTYNVYGKEVIFAVKNNDGASITGENITYTVEASAGGTLALVSGQEGTLAGASANQTAYKLTGTGEITVTARASAPYAKEISAKFVFSEEVPTKYTVVDYGKYITLKIDVGTRSENIEIHYGSSLTPDNSSHALMHGWSNATNETLPITPYTHYELIFIENASGDYDYANSETELSGNTITLAAK